jgi:isoaspartyl peptidase/L-asparaginase-like protein (Ntn-hydrolase superfamily)
MGLHSIEMISVYNSGDRAGGKKLKTFGTGTVGCVVLDSKEKIAVATSTGGKGFEIPGRISDSATVAGNYNELWCELDWSRRRYCE